MASIRHADLTAAKTSIPRITTTVGFKPGQVTTNASTHVITATGTLADGRACVISAPPYGPATITVDGKTRQLKEKELFALSSSYKSLCTSDGLALGDRLFKEGMAMKIIRLSQEQHHRDTFSP
ncbi:MAG: hypothetical protein K1X89_14895 [Myxococcaceae bacterium]|nr:hypothetical protein [Myxococcaceae bacterium]